jgi:hypothetical protein
VGLWVSTAGKEVNADNYFIVPRRDADCKKNFSSQNKSNSKGVNRMTTTTTAAYKAASAAATAELTFERKPLKFASRVGSTDFIINVRFSQTSKETLQDKILRLIEREVANA